MEAFFAEPDCRYMQIAPDGKHLAFLTTLGFGKVGVALMDLTTGNYEPLVSAKDENIKYFFWKGSDYIVYGGDIGGEESYAWRAIPVEPPKPGKKRRVVSLAEAFVARHNENARFMSIIDTLDYDPHNLLVFGRGEAGDSHVGMFLVDVRDGRRTVVRDYRPADADEVRAYFDTNEVADNNGNLRARTRVEAGKTIVEARNDTTKPYVRLAEFPIDQSDWSLLFFAADNNTLYLTKVGEKGTRALHSLDMPTFRLSDPIFEAPEGEIQEVIMSWDRSTLYGVSYLSDKTHYHFFDKGHARIQQSIDARLPGTINRIVGTSKDEQVILILAESDRDPGTYYVLDRTNRRMGAVGKVRTAIDPAQMQPMEPISYKARDGLVIHGYLTRPAGFAGSPVPLIILPHGGPYGIRDVWGFDPEVQFLANRGYAVLQVNYRGSGGYGDGFMFAGFHEWGGKMQDDLSDGVKWAIDQGVADPARVAIYGASYGGYAALAGMVFTPELYRCGANYLGPVDLSLQVGLGRLRRSSDATEAFYAVAMGNDKDYLEARSPLNHIERLRAPLFNAYGYNDPRVDFRHWTRLESKLKKHKKTYEIVIEDEEGHGFDNEKSRLALYSRLEAFFDRNLAPEVVPSANGNKD